MIIIEGTIKVRDLDLARKPMEQMISESRAEEGCIDYAYAVDLLEPGLIRVSERWTSRDALKRHLASDHIKEWRSAWKTIGVSDRSLRLYEADAEEI